MPRTLGWLYRKLGRRYFPLFLVFEYVSGAVITLATVGLFSLYEDMTKAEFWRVVAVAQACVTLGMTYYGTKVWRLSRPLIEWAGGERSPAAAPAVWRRAVELPRQMVTTSGWRPFAMISVPIAVYCTIDFALPWYSAAIIFGASLVAVTYATLLHFFAAEAFLRPVIADAAAALPGDWPGHRTGVPLRWKLLGGLPLINVITGVVVSGLSTDSTASLEDLGVDVIVAVLVAFTVSLELTVLLSNSVLGPVDALLQATERVKRGDLDARVPVTSGDELGALAGSFNEMMDGLSEREALRRAFGSYVDPDVAERVLAEGELLEGREVEVTVLFVDLRDFTPFAERSSARETVAFLNRFFELAVPILHEHGGHANKFVGDGILGVFGAPERLPDHADRALSAACRLESAVRETFGGEVGIGVGVNSGPVVVGSVGGGGRLEFAVIGDPVNVAARVEAATRETGDTVLLTEATRCLLERPDEFGIQERGTLPLKGKREPVLLYAAARVDERTAPPRDRLIAGG